MIHTPVKRSRPALHIAALSLSLACSSLACDAPDELEDSPEAEFALEDPSPDLLMPPPVGSDEVPPARDNRNHDQLDVTTSPAGYNWTNVWFSDETGPSTCNTGQLMTGAKCYDSYCDYMQLECHDIASHTLAGRIWSGWIGDNQWYECPGDRFVSGMACRGDYCDDVAVECTSTYYVPSAEDCTWSDWFSEEGGYFYAPTGTAVRGLQCSGSHCDNKRYYYCTL